MYWCKGLKVIYVSLIVLEANMNTRAMESRASFVSQNGNELRSLDICTAKNQQRLGSVYGNFTRHHKKGHRRRTTTTSAPTTFSYTSTTTTTDVDETINYAKTTEFASYQTTHVNLPKPLRLSARVLDTDYPEDVHNIDMLIDEEIDQLFVKERHRLKHERNSNKELFKELSETSLKSNLNKAKRMYRDSSASIVNKVNKNNRGGIFLTENCTTVIAQIGTTAILHCEVSDITENTVTWIRKKDYSLLSVGLVTYSADRRFSSAHGRHVKDWALHIRFATSADGGYYECQVPTHPPTSIFFKLVLVAAYAEIVGESEKIIHEGSMLRLVCVVRRSTEPPSYVFWYFENRMINYDLNGVSVHNGRQTSELVIGKAEPRHAGNYTCVPANAKAASVTVHVVQSETPAAMQHGNNSANFNSQANMVILVLLLHLITMSITHCQIHQDIG